MSHNSKCGKRNVYSRCEIRPRVIESKIIRLQKQEHLSKVTHNTILTLLCILGTKSEGDKYSVT